MVDFHCAHIVSHLVNKLHKRYLKINGVNLAPTHENYVAVTSNTFRITKFFLLVINSENAVDESTLLLKSNSISFVADVVSSFSK